MRTQVMEPNEILKKLQEFFPDLYWIRTSAYYYYAFSKYVDFTELTPDDIMIVCLESDGKFMISWKPRVYTFTTVGETLEDAVKGLAVKMEPYKKSFPEI